VLGAPLFAVEAVAWTVPDPQGCAGILAGSANLFRLGGPGLAALTALPVLAVGAKPRARRAMPALPWRPWAKAAWPKWRGIWRRAATAPVGRRSGAAGGAAGRGGGHDHGLCGAAPAPLGGGAGLLAQPCVVALHSGEAARHFAAECTRLGLARGQIALACLAPRIAAMAGSGWQAVEISAMRRDQPLLALAHQMCQNL
jgi:uroporphyrinogen-III synthase